MPTNNVWNSQDPCDVGSGGTGRNTLTNHAVLVGATTTAITQLAVGTNGQVLLGSSAADPVFGTLTSSDSTIVYTTGAGSLGLQCASKIISVTISLTNAQIKTIHATPITVVAAPAAGTYVSVVSAAAKMTYGGTNAFTNGSSNPLGLFYTNNAGQAAIASILSSASIIATATQIQVSNTSALTGVAYSGVDAKALVISSLTATEIAGNAAANNTIKVTVNYQLLTI